MLIVDAASGTKHDNAEDDDSRWIQKLFVREISLVIEQGIELEIELPLLTGKAGGPYLSAAIRHIHTGHTYCHKPKPRTEGAC